MPYTPYQFNFNPDRDLNPATNPFPQQRMKNIFAKPETTQDNVKRLMSGINPTPQLDAQPPPKSSPVDDNIDEGGRYFDAMRKMSQRGPAVSAYQDALKDQPTEENTYVSTARKIMGTIGGVAGGLAHGPEGGINTANEIIGSPYRTAMRDYQVKMKNLGESAKLEQDDQTSQLNAMGKAREYGLKFNEFRQKMDDSAFERSIKDRTTSATESNAQAAARRAAAAELAAGNQGRNIDSEIATRTGTLENERQRTGIQRQNAGTAAQVANTGAAAQADTAEYHKGELAARNRSIDVRNKAGKTVTPSQQAYAVDNALRELATDPRFKKFITSNTDKGTFNMGEDDNSLMYQEFKRRVKSLAESSISKGTPFDTDIDEPVTIGSPR